MFQGDKEVKLFWWQGQMETREVTDLSGPICEHPVAVVKARRLQKVAFFATSAVFLAIFLEWPSSVVAADASSNF